MKQYLLFLLAFLISNNLFSASKTILDNPHNTTNFSSLAPLQLKNGEGLSAMMAGVSESQVLVAGGSNFPDIPAAKGGEKKYYSEVFTLEGGAWKLIGHLPKPIAYGASVNLPEGVLCLGGNNQQHTSAQCYLLSYHQKTLQIIPYPNLPEPLQQMAAAVDSKGNVYVAGGLKSDGTPNRNLYVFNLKEKEWKTRGKVPGDGRVQPTAVVQNGATGEMFFLLGGYDPLQLQCAQESLIYDIGKDQWTPTAPMQLGGKPFALVGASSVKSGSQFIVIAGGIDKAIFEQAIQGKAGTNYLNHAHDWYKFRQSFMIYNTITNTWIEESHSPHLAKAGASLITNEKGWMLIGGESKPGIRSTEVIQVEMNARSEFGTLNWLVLITYLLGMILLGYYFMKREKGAGDFFTGGGRIPWWAAGISIYATMLSAITYMAYPAKAYATNWTYYPMLITILLVSIPVMKYYLPFFRRLSITSAYEYLELRFNLPLRLLASALFIIFMIARMALVLYLPSLALTAVTGIDIYVCIILMAIITIIYCTMGGVEAVVWGDVVQGFILVGGALLAVAYLIGGTEGGLVGFWEITQTDEKLKLFDWSWSWESATFWVIIVGGMANNLISYTSDQTVIQRYLTTKDENAARRSIMLNGVMSVFVSIVFFAIGAGLYTFFKTQPAEMNFTMAKNDIIFPFFIMSQLPAGVAGLLIAAIFAATMSTISSNINSVATAFTMDFYKRFRISTTDKQQLLAARYSSLLSGVVGMLLALLMATWNILSLLDFFQEILGLLSSGLGGLFLMGILFPRIGGKAATIGFLAGVGSVFLIKYYTSASFLLYGAIGIIVSVCVGYAFSFIFERTKAPDHLTLHSLKK